MSTGIVSDKVIFHISRRNSSHLLLAQTYADCPTDRDSRSAVSHNPRTSTAVVLFLCIFVCVNSRHYKERKNGEKKKRDIISSETKTDKTISTFLYRVTWSFIPSQPSVISA